MSGKHRKPETRRQRREFTVLPPSPDPQTGEPIPPHAPKYKNADLHPADNRDYELRLSRKPKPPPGMGPVLVWHRDSIKGQFFGYAFAVGILVVGFAVISLIEGDGLSMLAAWPIWIVIGIGAYLMSSPLDFKTVSAGADWFQTGRRKRWYQRRARLNYVKLYELVKVTGSYAGASFQLYLEDADGRGMYRTLNQLQPDRKTWDLIYNGILHSVANGADTDKISNDLLGLHNTPVLGIRDGDLGQ